MSILFAGSLVLCATAFAAKTNKKTMHLYEKAKLEGKVLNPGDYKVEWNGAGPNVELNIVQGRDTLATVPAESWWKILPMSMTARSSGRPGTVASRLRRSSSVEPSTI